MKRETLLSKDVVSEVEAILGPARHGDLGDQAMGLMTSREDHVFIWSRGTQSLLAVYVGTGAQGIERVQELQLASCPTHTVEEVAVSRTGLWVALWGPEGATAVQLPRRSGLSGRLGGGARRPLCRSVAVCAGEEVQDVAWHPGSATESHLVMMTRDGRLSLHNPADGVGEVRGISVGSGQGKMAKALGEAAVSLSFGGPGASGQWPLFVVFGNCDVYCVRSAIGSEWGVEGPLEVRPPREDNYVGEACSLTVAGGSVLAMATVGGVVYHSVVLGGETTSLHMYERVELDLGAVGQSEDSEGVFSCPVRLRTDGSLSSRYLATHRAGVHHVELPMVAQLREEKESLDMDKLASTVEHLVCTRPTPTAPPAPVLGACLAFPPSTVLCLLSDNSLTSINVSTPSSGSVLLSSEDDITVDIETDSQGPHLDSKIAAILTKSSSQPLLLSGPGTNLSPAETLELLTSATSTLRREYTARLQVAREELVRKADNLSVRRTLQESELAKLEEERILLRDSAESLSERYEDVKDKGQELSSRVELVLAKIQAKVPELSDKELAMAREVVGLDRKVKALQGGIKQLKEKEKYQRYQVEASSGRRETMSQSRLTNMKEILQEDSVKIAELVQEVNEVKKELGI